MPFWPFLKLITFFSCIKKILTFITFVSIVFKTITNQKYEDNLVLKFLISKFKNAHFWGSPNLFYIIFFLVLGFETIETQMLFRSVFLKMHEKKFINLQKWPKWCFWQLITFFWCIFKNTELNNNRVFIVCKAELKPKHEEKIFFGCFSPKTKNALFRG